MASPTRWGIISAGKISSDFVNALKVSEFKEEHQVVAVAARNINSAKAFADKFGISRTYGSYDQLAADPEIDAVYLGAIHPVHLTITKMLINSGKSVLCEKPMGMNLRETQEMVDLAREKGVFLMEAMWSWFNPAHKKLREELASGKIGEVFQAHATFGVQISEVERLAVKDLGGGATLDIGIYVIAFSQLVFGGQEPTKIIASGHLNQDGVDESMGAVLTYPSGKTATITVHTRVEMPCEAEVFGTKGRAKLSSPFWCSRQLSFNDGKEKISFDYNESEIPFNFWNSSYLSLEAQHVRECLQKGLKESPVVTFNDTLLFAKIMENIRKQIGVKYVQDE